MLILYICITRSLSFDLSSLLSQVLFNIALDIVSQQSNQPHIQWVLLDELLSLQNVSIFLVYIHSDFFFHTFP